MRSALLRGGALREPEVANLSAPVKAGRCRVIFVCVVEGAIVHWIDCQISVIAPATAGAGLAAGAIKKMLFTGQCVQWIGN